MSLRILNLININTNKKIQKFLHQFLPTLFFGATIFALGWLLYAGICAFTWRKFTFFDYGVYSNAIWNTLHGHPFQCGGYGNYLYTHLSFSLALLAPIYLIWDHPFALWAAEWLLLSIGILCVALTGIRLRIHLLLVASFAFLFATYRFSQTVLLSEFHGVSLYFIAVPFLYYSLRFNKRLVPAFLIVLWGIREEAAFTAIPMLLYFAKKDSWKLGYYYAILSLFYGLIAIFGLYPLINGITLFQRRRHAIGRSPLFHTGLSMNWNIRFRSLFWIVLPLLPFLRKKTWLPVLSFPFFCVLKALLSGYYRQYALVLHYPAPIFSFLIVGMLEASSLETKKNSIKINLIALYTIAIALLSNAYYGFLPVFRIKPIPKCYKTIHLRGIKALEAIHHLPKKGLLLCHYTLAGFCANRHEIIDIKTYYRHGKSKRYKIDIVFGKIPGGHQSRPLYLKLLSNNQFGVTFFDGWCFIMKRGAPHVANSLLKSALTKKERLSLLFTHTLSHKETNVENVDYQIPVLHWKGGKKRTATTFGRSHPIRLKTGKYVALFLFSAKAPEEDFGRWGSFLITDVKRRKVLISQPIQPIALGQHLLRIQKLYFKLDKPSTIQSCVVGENASIWIDRVIFILLSKNQ